MFVYESIFKMLELKKDRGIDCYWLEIKGYTPEVRPLHITFLHRIKGFGSKMGIKSDKKPFTGKQMLTLSVI